MARRKDYVPRTDGPGSGRRARGPAHRVASLEVNEHRALPVHTTVQHCRCGAWRALVQLPLASPARGARELVTDWSAPCSDSSPAPARDDA